MILSFLFTGRATLENPSTSLSNPDAWLYDALGGTPSTSGVRVNSRTAFHSSAFWRGVMLIGSTIGKLPCFVYRRVGKGKERDRGHTAHKLVWRRPNSEMSAMVYRETLMGHVLTRGNHYSWIDRYGGGPLDGQARELIPLDPNETYPVRENGQLLYVTRVKRGLDPDAGYERRKLLPENVLHIKGLGYDGLVGYDVLTFAKNSLGLGLAVEEYGARFFRNNAEPAVVIETPKILSAKARAEFKQEWESMHAGLSQSHKIALLQEGATIKPYSVTARQSQLLETREFELKSIANWLGVPVHKVGHDGRTSYNSLEMENQAFLNDSIDPWLKKIEEEFYEKLLTEQEKEDETHVIEFLRDAVLRADTQARYAAHQIALQNGIKTRNEVRADENLNPVEGGDEFILPENIYGKSKDEPAEDEEPETDEDVSPVPDSDADGTSARSQVLLTRQRVAQRQLYVSTLGRMVKRLAVHARKAAKTPKKFDSFLETIEAEHHEVVRNTVYEVVSAIYADGDPHEYTRTVVGGLFTEFKATLNTEYSTRSEKEFAAAIDQQMTRFETEWAEKAADREWTLNGTEV